MRPSRSGVVSHPAPSAKSRLKKMANTDIRCMGFLLGCVMGGSIAEDGGWGKRVRGRALFGGEVKTFRRNGADLNP